MIDFNKHVAILIGGAERAIADYNVACNLCRALDLDATVFAANDMIELFPGRIDHAVTLHPEKLKVQWIPGRERNGYPKPGEVWAHRWYDCVTKWTKDWGGSSGLLMIKIAREMGFRKVILCGVPMTVEDNHFRRGQPWTAAHGFRRAWGRQIRDLKPFVRSFSGWTAEQFGNPTPGWLLSEINDPNPPKWTPVELTA